MNLPGLRLPILLVMMSACRPPVPLSQRVTLTSVHFEESGASPKYAISKAVIAPEGPSARFIQ